jgi:putative transcriptional regulator
MLGENIKRYRQEKHLTQEEVAGRLHVTRQTVSKWEKNHSVPDADLLVKLADVLGVETSRLLGAEPDEEAEATQEPDSALAEQLAAIAQQMAIKNRRSKRLWKTIGIVLAILAAATILITVFSMVSYSSVTSTEESQGYEQTEQAAE